MKQQHGATIRAYRDDLDRDRLAEIWLAASRVGHPFLSEAELLEQLAQVRDIYLPQAENWVVEDEAGQIGFIGLIDDFIGGLFVDPTAHGGGYGKALVLHAVALKGTLDVEVYAANAAAIAFYRRLGFLEVSRGRQEEKRFARDRADAAAGIATGLIWRTKQSGRNGMPFRPMAGHISVSSRRCRSSRPCGDRHSGGRNKDRSRGAVQ